MILGRQALGLRRKSWENLDFGETSTRSEGILGAQTGGAGWRGVARGRLRQGGPNFIHFQVFGFQMVPVLLPANVAKEEKRNLSEERCPGVFDEFP